MGNARKNVLWILLLLITAAVQATWFEGLQFRGVLPNLVLILVVYFSLSDGEERGMATALVGGLFQDVAAATSLGHHVLCYVIVAYTVGTIAHRLIIDHPAVKAAAVLISAVAYGLLFTIVAYIQDPARGIIDPIMRTVVPAAFYTAVITPFVFIALDTMRRNKTPMRASVTAHE